MKLEDLNIFRVREIDHLKINFGDKRLVAVLGENGSGKTTLLGCIIYLLSGEVIFKGGKERMVRDVGSGDSWVAGTIRHGEHHFKLKRFVSSSSCELTYLNRSSSKPVKTPTKVQAELDAMGLTAAKVLRTLLEQGKYGGMFHSTDGDRLRLMFEIFGLTDSDEIQDAIGAEAALIPIDVTIDDRWSAAQARLKAAEGVVHNTMVEKESVGAEVETLREAKAILARAVEAEAIAAELNKLRGRHDAMVAAEDSLAKETGGLSVECGVLAAAVESQRFDAAEAEKVVAAMNAYRAMSATFPTHVAASKRAGDMVQELRVAALAAQVPEPGAVEAVRSEVSALVAEKATKEAMVSEAARIDAVKVAAAATEKDLGAVDLEIAKVPGDLDARIAKVDDDFRLLTEQVALAKSGVCPTCKQRLPTAHECMPLSESEPLLQGCSAQRVALYGMRTTSQQLQQAKNVLAAKLTALTDQIKASTTTFDVVQLRGQIDAMAKVIAEKSAWLDDVTVKLARRSEIMAKLSRAEAEFEAAQAAMAAIEKAKVDPAKYEAAAAVCDAFAKQKSRAEACKAMLVANTERLRTARADIDAVAAQIAQVHVPGTIDPVEVEKAREIMGRAADLESRWMAVNSAFSVAESEHRTAAQEFSTLDVLKKQNEVNKKKHELIADMKFLVGVKQFPMFVAGFYVQAINALWAEELSVVDASFSAWQDESTLEFYATFHGSDQTRMLYQLSGGERQLASVCYQVVINKLFAAGVDWVAFDEPTTHVDAKSRPKLVQAFTRMLQREDIKDLQIFVVDHSIEFANAISDPIVLSKEG